MNGPIAQIVALTCHANAFLRGLPIFGFFPGNSTCQFCDWVKFQTVSQTILGKARATLVADNPNDWFQHLKATGILGIRLYRTPQDNPGISDRMSSAFVGGGGSWAMEAFQDRAKSAVWLSRWQVWNQNAPERRIWRVDYAQVSEEFPPVTLNDSLELTRNRFRYALAEIHAFSDKHGCGGFTAFFSRAMETLDSDGVIRHGYHKDLVVDGLVPSLAEGLLDAAQSAWVFGGMGSWNDLVFEGADQADYDRVSQQLFTVLNDTIQIATNASYPS